MTSTSEVSKRITKECGECRGTSFRIIVQESEDDQGHAFLTHGWYEDADIICVDCDNSVPARLTFFSRRPNEKSNPNSPQGKEGEIAHDLQD